MGIWDSITGNNVKSTSEVVQQKSQVLVQMTQNDFMMILFFVALAVGVLAWIFSIVYKVYISKRFPYDVTLKYIVNDRCIVKQTKARVKYRKGESEIFVFKGGIFKKLSAPIPPEKSIEILSSGRMYIKGYVRKNDNIVWAEDTIKWESLKSIGTDKDGKEIYPNSIDEKIQPITQQHRALWFDEMRKAERDKTRKLSELLLAIAPLLMVMIIFIMVIIFWKDITNPIIKAEELQKEMKELDIKIIDKLNVLYKIQNGTQLTLYDRTVFNDTDENRFNSQQVIS
jgi:hypothetical protein